MTTSENLCNKQYRKELRDKIVNFILDKIRSTGLPDNITGFLLRTIHFHIPFYFLLFFIFFPIKLAFFTLFLLLIPFIAFFYFNGCFITIVEHKLCKDDITVIDPYIILCKDKITIENRYNYTIGLSIPYFSVVSLILYLKYINEL